MQLAPRYLVKNRTILISNTSGFITEYCPVYHRNINIFKGIDNTIQFKLLNADQKPINTSLYRPIFMLVDAEKTLIIEKEATVLDDGSSNTKGLFEVTITEGELLNYSPQYMSYFVYLLDSQGNKEITYANSSFQASGTVYLDDSAYPSPRESLVIDSFFRVDDETYVSEVITAQPYLNNNSGLHTFAIYNNGYQGTVEVEATLDNQVTNLTNWGKIGDLELASTDQEPLSLNSTGMYSYFRFKFAQDPRELVTKILIRN